MANIRRIYYDKTTGNRIVEVGFNGNVTPSTIEKDIVDFTSLSERNRSSFDVLEIPYTQYAQDFIESQSNYRVNIETKTIEFSYPDPNEPEVEQPYVKPLTEQIKEVENQANATSMDLQAFMDFYFENGGF